MGVANGWGFGRRGEGGCDVPEGAGGDGEVCEGVCSSEVVSWVKGRLAELRCDDWLANQCLKLSTLKYNPNITLTLTLALSRNLFLTLARAPRAPACQARPFRRLLAPGTCSRLPT